jgi:alpha-beta hydrolase superfamily lysophospholipase
MDIAKVTTTETLAPSAVKSVAQWIGSSERPLFAWIDLPGDGLVTGAAVLCPSVGLEAAYSARAVRDLAHRLAGSGWAALRIDYAGTGDSSGEWTDPELVSDWLRSIRVAIDYAQGLGAPRLAVVGLRLGATLAAAELAQAGGADDLVMWDPCAAGSGFLREQRALWAFRRSQALEWGTLREGESWGSGEVTNDGSLEAPGALYSASTVAELQGIAVAPEDRLASRELVLNRDGRKVPRALAERQSIPHVRFEKIVGQEALLNPEAITPEPTLELIVSWLTEDSRHPVGVLRPGAPIAITHASPDGPGVVERPLQMGPTGLFGILSEPESAGTDIPTVVFFNAGRIGHQGPARLWVDMARVLARDGFRCVRADLSGLGDSPTRPGRTESVEFPADALEDLREIGQAITTQWGPEVVLVGLCSGGYHVIEWALADPVSSVCVVNPVLLDFGMGQQPFRRFEPREEGTSHDDRKAWGTPHPWVTRTMSRLGSLREVAQKFPGGWWVLKRVLVNASPAKTFERLTQSGVEVFLVIDSDGARSMRKGEQRRWDTLLRRENFRLQAVPHLEHSLLERTGRERVSALLCAQLRRWRVTERETTS